jgi:methylated-DNA-[protein]-cysteine S-methyltransferase
MISCSICFCPTNSNRHKPLLPNLLRQELDLYFQGRLKVFATPLETIGTAFQQQVWNALLTIPYGETRSYKEQAQQLGNPKAVRAVAAANGQNKVSILIPCHRVIGSDGKLTGYAGGLNRKQSLLALERGEVQSPCRFRRASTDLLLLNFFNVRSLPEA